MFLCRDGLSNVLQLSRRKKQSIVPPSKLIGKRYRLLCISKIFHALVLYRTSLLKLCRIQSENPFADTVKWSSPFFVEAIKKVNRIHSYSGKDGISTFCSQLGITKAVKNEENEVGSIFQFATSHDTTTIYHYRVPYTHNGKYRIIEHITIIYIPVRSYIFVLSLLRGILHTEKCTSDIRGWFDFSICYVTQYYYYIPLSSTVYT
jgi:hypothetical protein